MNYSASFNYSTDFLFYTAVDRIMISVLIPIIFAVGVVGNCAVITVFYRIKEMRTVTNCYLIALSISDLLFLVSSVPVYWVSYRRSPIPEDLPGVSLSLCKLSIYSSDVSFMVSVLLVLLVTVERYMAINLSWKSKKLTSKRRAITSCILVWVLVIIYKIPDLYFVKLTTVALDHDFWPVPEHYPDTVSYCQYCNLANATEWCGFFNKSLIVEGVLPLVEVIPLAILYSIIVVKLKRHYRTNSPRRMTNGHGSKLYLRRESQVTRLLVVTVIVFGICVMPFQILHVLPDPLRRRVQEELPISRNIVRMLLYINSAINPVLYNLVSGNFRNAFRKLFHGCFLFPYQCSHQFKSSTREIHLELNEISRNRGKE